MLTHVRLLWLPLLLGLLGFSLNATAGQFKDFGDYRIYYNAFKSDMIAPEVAKAHGLTRSRYRAVINITVQKRAGDGRYLPVQAKVEGSARDIYSTITTLSMEKVTEGKAIYYLAEFPIIDEQTLKFDIRVIPKGEKIARQITFSQQFFVN